MNERIIQLGLNSGMLNYIDHETPRVYFLDGNADEDCLAEFAELIVRECIELLQSGHHEVITRHFAARIIKEHFGVEE